MRKIKTRGATLSQSRLGVMSYKFDLLLSTLQWFAMIFVLINNTDIYTNIREILQQESWAKRERFSRSLYLLCPLKLTLYVRGVPINMGIQWHHLYRLRFASGIFFMNTIIAVFQLRQLLSKKLGIGILKMWSTIFASSKLTELLQNVHKGFEFLPQMPIL